MKLLFIFLISFFSFTCICSGVSSALEEEDFPNKEEKVIAKHRLHWWEKYFTHPHEPTPEQQMEFADKLFKEGKLRKAANEYRALVFAWPDSPQAPEAQYKMANILQQRGKLKRAFEEYQFLIEAYISNIQYDKVLEKQYEIANAIATNVHRFLFIKYQSPEDAIPLFEQLIANGVNWTNAPDLQFKVASIYEKAGELDMAIDAYAMYHQRYPMGNMAEQALFGQAKASYLYSKKYPVSNELRENAILALNAFLDWYPKSPMASLAKNYLAELEMEMAYALYNQALLYDRTAFFSRERDVKITNMRAAIICYARLIDEFGDSRWADVAHSRIVNIKYQLSKLEGKK